MGGVGAGNIQDESVGTQIPAQDGVLHKEHTMTPPWRHASSYREISAALLLGPLDQQGVVSYSE